VLKGVTIGRGAIVGANTQVMTDVEPFTVVAGNPMRVVRKLDETDLNDGEE
jgi:maltose O-acetyltransferase